MAAFIVRDIAFDLSWLGWLGAWGTGGRCASSSFLRTSTVRDPLDFFNSLVV
jgi:hypothetical protein